MNWINSLSINDKDYLQSTLYWIAGIILFLYSVVLTLAPAVRLHAWAVAYRWEHWIGFGIWLVSSYLINHFSAKKYPHRDPFILPIVSLLSGLGLLSIFRLNIDFGWRQSAWISLATIMVIAGLLKSEWFSKIRYYKYFWLVIGLLLTALTFFLGIYPGGQGPQLWLNFGGIFLQPSEPLKVLIIIYLSGYLADQWAVRRQFPSLIVPTLVMFTATILILIGQRDLGTASLFILVYAFYVFMATGKALTIFIFGLVLLVAGFIGYQFFYVIKIRVDSWVNLWADPVGSSYQVIQSLQALAAGKLIGTGPGIGSPGLVPVAISDFIFSSIAEELGFIGALTVFVLYAFLTYRGFMIAIKARNHYQRLLAAGITILISAQAMLILAGNTRMLPLTGVTLPLISYGGSSLLTSFFAILLLLWISNQPSNRPISTAETKPYLISLNLILAGFFGLALLSGWWSIIRTENLLSRPDNFRKVISDRYVIRGSILDRRNLPLAVTSGEPGNYSRTLNDPSLSATVGYSDPLYGLGGLEQGMDQYLRGLDGLPSSNVIFANLLFSQPPPGLDVRTSIDLSLQEKLSSALETKDGAAIIMNAETGEILALWTSPTFDSNRINSMWDTWLADPTSPLINRVTQGKYPTGSLMTPFILAYLDLTGSEIRANPADANCAIPLDTQVSLTSSEMIASGCQSILNESIARLSQSDVYSFLETYGWTSNPDFPLPLTEPYTNENEISLEDLDKGLDLSPLQVARAASTFSNAGFLPNPRLAMAVHTPQQGWLILAAEEGHQIFNNPEVTQLTASLARLEYPAWEVISNSTAGEKSVSWYLGGTLPDWKGTPLVLVITLENENGIEVKKVGEMLMMQLTNTLPAN